MRLMKVDGVWSSEKRRVLGREVGFCRVLKDVKMVLKRLPTLELNCISDASRMFFFRLGRN